MAKCTQHKCGFGFVVFLVGGPEKGTLGSTDLGRWNGTLLKGLRDC